jgi:hypothetical protein
MVPSSQPRRPGLVPPVANFEAAFKPDTGDPHMTIQAFLTTALLVIAPSGSHGGPAIQAERPPLDPACFAAADWLVDPEAAPMQIFGCRESAQIPAPNAQGWVTYAPAGGGFVWGKLETVSSENVWTFRVMINTGGSGNFESIVTGEPDMNGIIQSPKVVAVPGE